MTAMVICKPEILFRISLQPCPYKCEFFVRAWIFFPLSQHKDRLCVLVVGVSGYRSRGPGFDSRRYQIFWEVAAVERAPLSLVRITEELLDWKVAAPA
jgi:hypothetical protein